MADAERPRPEPADIDIDDDARPRPRWLRLAVWLLTIFIVVALLALPILRAISASRGRDDADAARDARAFVATQFAQAVLEHRSTRLAESWALERDELRAAIDAAVADLQLRDPAELAGATAMVYHAPCPASAPTVGATAECFEGRLARPDGGLVATLDFTVAIVDGRATVVALQAGTSV